MSIKNILGIILGVAGFVGVGSLLTIGFFYRSDALAILKGFINGTILGTLDDPNVIEVKLPDGTTIKIDPKISYNICWIGPLKNQNENIDGLKNKDKIISILNDIVIINNEKIDDSKAEEIFKSEKPWLIDRSSDPAKFAYLRIKVIELTDLGCWIAYGKYDPSYEFDNDVKLQYDTAVKNQLIYVGE